MSEIKTVAPSNTEPLVNVAQASVRGRPPQRDAIADTGVSQDYDNVQINSDVVTLENALNNLRLNERQFEVDKELKQVIVKVINADTKELIRQIPTEHVIQISRSMQKTFEDLKK